MSFLNFMFQSGGHFIGCLILIIVIREFIIAMWSKFLNYLIQRKTPEYKADKEKTTFRIFRPYEDIR
jgi:hypothetical protein